LLRIPILFTDKGFFDNLSKVLADSNTRFDFWFAKKFIQSLEQVDANEMK